MAKKILIVDDASYMREMIKDAVIKAGFDVAGEAEDGKDALARYKELSPDVVTMDIVMREKSGIDAVKEIARFDANSRVIVISAMGQQSMIVDAIQAGAKGFVLKPFKAEVLIEEIKRVLGE